MVEFIVAAIVFSAIASGIHRCAKHLGRIADKMEDKTNAL